MAIPKTLSASEARALGIPDGWTGERVDDFLVFGLPPPVIAWQRGGTRIVCGWSLRLFLNEPSMFTIVEHRDGCDFMGGARWVRVHGDRSVDGSLSDLADALIDTAAIAKPMRIPLHTVPFTTPTESEAR